MFDLIVIGHLMNLSKTYEKRCLSILEHSLYPLQHILTDLQITQSYIPFLDSVFDFITASSNINQLSFDGASLEQMPLEQSFEAAKFDFMLTFIYNPASNDNKLSFQLMCSRDLVDQVTVEIIARRFEHLFEQIFTSDSRIDQVDSSLSNFDLMLPEEVKEIEDVVFCRQPNIIDEGMFIY